MIYKIAIVDDEANVQETVENSLKNYALKMNSKPDDPKEYSFEIHTYSNGEELLKENLEDFDIYFLDINMPGINGLKLAKQIRLVNTVSAIIFCTNYAQYAINGYEVDALGYIIKPINPVLFSMTMDRIMNFIDRRSIKRIRIKTAERVKLLNVASILYVEIKLHTLFFYVLNPDGTISIEKTRGSMHEAESNLSDKDFTRCSACYLVNLHHILSYAKANITIEGDISLPVSRKYSKAFSKTLLSYFANFETINV